MCLNPLMQYLRASLKSPWVVKFMGVATDTFDEYTLIRVNHLGIYGEF